LWRRVRLLHRQSSLRAGEASEVVGRKLKQEQKKKKQTIIQRGIVF
jgi:hypothetical protein